MKYCKSCGVNVDTDRMTCPLCKEVLEYFDDSHIKGMEQYLGYKEKPKKLHIVRKLFLFLSIIVLTICAVVNIMTYNGTLWSLIVAGTILYLWVLVKFTILSRKNIAKKLVLQAAAILLLFVFIQSLTPDTRWALPYALPFVMLATCFAITLLILIKTMRYKDYMLYLVSVALVGLIPLLLSIIDATKFLFEVNEKIVRWPSIVCSLYALFTIIGLFIFGDRATKDEFKKRFHI